MGLAPPDPLINFSHASKLDTNVLYYGDNLYVLRNHVPDESIDLIYLDPPFNSNRSYNVLFKESSGAGSEAQLEAFEDTWHWAGPRPRLMNLCSKVRRTCRDY